MKCFSRIIIVFCLLVLPLNSWAANRLYFSGLSTVNSGSGNMDIVLAWGELDGVIPANIMSFRLYRKLASASSYPATPLATIALTLVNADSIDGLFNETGELQQRQEIIAMLDKADKDNTITAANYALKLHHILDPVSSDYDAFQRKFFSRYSRNVARAIGLGYIDRNVGNDSFTYMLVGVHSNNSETKPLGISTVNSSSVTVLPAPANFQQTYVGSCSELQRNLDHGRVHFKWHLPISSMELGQQILLYGYDLYRADTNLGSLDLRASIPSTLTKVNDGPVIASGAPESESSDDYLAKDPMDHTNNTLKPGQTYWYYLVGRDLAGFYSDTAGPLEVTVPDRRAPVMPWNVHADRTVEDVSSTLTPRMKLVWDKINAINYLKQYKSTKKICSGTATEVCFVPDGQSCSEAPQICTDLAVEKYRIYRYASFEEATDHVTDSDGDGWFDQDDSDPCDPTLPATGTPPYLVSTLSGTAIDQATTILDTGKKVLSILDPAVTDNNHVHWYRIAAVDASGNNSPLSPPARAALWDMSMPDAGGSLYISQCDYIVDIEPDSEQPPVLTVKDITGDAVRFSLFEKLVCQTDGTGSRLILSRDQSHPAGVDLFEEDFAGISLSCGNEASQMFVRYYDASGKQLAQSPDMGTPSFPANHIGVTILNETCDAVAVPGGADNPSDPGLHIADNGTMKICAPLTQSRECARVYQEIGGEMTPTSQFCYGDVNTTLINDETCITQQVASIVSYKTCMGVRSFSRNHVGSAMHYFDCITVPSKTPDAPNLLTVAASGNSSSPEFIVKWSSQPDGISAFSVEGTEASELTLKSFYNLEPTGAGLYTTGISINAGDVNKEWCYRVRSLDKAMQSSPWSNEVCATWTPEPVTNSLGWPNVSAPPDKAELAAFLLEDVKIGAIVLSGSIQLDSPAGCEMPPPGEFECDGTNAACLDGRLFQNCISCEGLQAWNDMGDFVLYRQEENRDYVQVGPLVDMIHCSSSGTDTQLEDPLVYMVYLKPAAVGGVSPGYTELDNSYRLIMADWYPYKPGKKYRYQLIRFDQLTNEPVETRTSEWLQF